jgi:hypothetical protein
MTIFEIAVLILLTLNLVITVILWGTASHFYDVLSNRSGVIRGKSDFFSNADDIGLVRPEDDADWWKRQ